MPLGLRQGEQLISSRTIDAASYQQYLHARVLVRARRFGVPQAIKILEPLVERNPDYAPAWALLSRAYSLEVNYARDSLDKLRIAIKEIAPKQEAAARRAIQLDPELSEGYVALGRVHRSQGNMLLAEDLFIKARMLDPNQPEALANLSNLLASVGRLKEGLAVREELRVLEPYVPGYNYDIAEIMWVNGQTDAAIAILKDLLGEVQAGIDLSRIYATQGRYNEAADILQAMPARIRTLPPEVVVEPVRLLRTAPAQTSSPQDLPRLGFLSFVYLHVGAPERALEPYEESAAAGFFAASGGEDAILWHPSYAPVRKTERYKAFMRKSGYVDYWRSRGWPDLCRPVGADDFVCD